MIMSMRVFHTITRLRVTVLLAATAGGTLHAADGVELGAIEAEALVAETARTAKVFRDDTLSGGAAVRLGRPGGKKQPAPDEAPTLTLIFKKPERAPFVLWARLLAPSSGSNSLWIAEGDAKQKSVNLEAKPQWRWQALWRSKSRGSEVVLKLYPRESGLALDRFVAAANFFAVPSGLSGALTVKPPRLKIPFPKPPILPPPEHPRLYLRRRHLPMIRKRVKHPLLAGEYQRLKKIADRKWDGTFPRPRPPAQGNYHRRYLEIIEANALLYLLENDESRGRRAKDMLIKALDTVEVADRHDVTRDYGRIIFCSAIVYDWCYALTDKAWRNAVLQHMIEFAAMTEIGFPPKRQGAVTGHGSEAQLMREQLSAGIAVYDEYPDWYLFGAGRFFAEYVPARNMVFQAHRHHQGDSYGWSRFRWSMYATFLFDRLGAGDVFDRAQGQVPYSWIYMRRGDGQFLRDGDTFSRGDYWMFPQGAMMVASYFRDPYINFAFRRMQKVRPGCVSPFWMVLLYDPTVQVKDIAELPLSRYFPSPAGDIIARTGWQLGTWSNAITAEMKGAFYHFNNHDHLDAGAFQIYYKGALATDAGCYGPYGTPYDRNWNKRSISHNTLLIYDPARKQDPFQHDGGQNFVLGGREPRTIDQVLAHYRDGETLAHGFGPDPHTPFYSFIRADLTPGYADRAAHVERSSLFLNLTGSTTPGVTTPGVMFVFDRIVPKAPSFRTVWLIHSVHKPALEDDTFDIRRTDGKCNGRLFGTMLLPEAANRRTAVIGGPGHEAEVFGHNFVPERPTLESQGWRLEISPRADAAEQRFLNVLQVMDAEPERQPPLVTRIVRPPFVGARAGDCVVLFSAQEKSIASKVSVTGGGAESANWVITGLKPGRWSVRRPDGGLVGVGTVNADDTVLCFRAAGTGFTLAPATAADAAVPLPQPDKPKSADIDVVAVLDGRPIPGVPPLVVGEGCTRVALEPLAKAFGRRIEKAGETVRIMGGGDRIELPAGGTAALVNGAPYRLAHPTAVADGSLRVALTDLPGILHCRQRLDPVTGVLELESPDPAYLWILGATASSRERGRGPGRAVDADLLTYWAAKGAGQWLQLDLGRPRSLTRVEIAWLHGDKRKEKFEVRISADGKRWVTVFNGESSGSTKGFETFPFPRTTGRYVRIVGHGNSANKWNSVCEVRIRKP